MKDKHNEYFKEECKVGENVLLSNGKMLAYLKNSDIISFHASGYTSPSFLSLTYGGEDYNFNSLTVRKNFSATYLHKIFFEQRIKREKNPYSRALELEDARFLDIIHPEKQIFVRHFESLLPFDLKITVPSYVRASLLHDYSIGHKRCDALCLVLPQGVGFYKNEFTIRESRVLIIADGCAKLGAGGECVHILPGASRLIFVSGSGSECIKNAEYALSDGNYFGGFSKTVSESERFFENSFAGSNIDINSEKGRALEEAALVLVSHQSAEGGVISAFSENIVRADSAHITVSAFLSLGLYDRAKRVLEFFINKFAFHKEFYQIYGTFDGQFERYFSNVSLGCPSLIIAFLDYAEGTGDINAVKDNLKMLKSALHEILVESSYGIMPFSGCEREVESGIIGVGTQYQGSLDGTLLACEAILRFTDFCEKHSLNTLRDNGSIRCRVCEMLENIKKYFLNGNRVAYNMPEREEKIRKPRFAYGNCDICRLLLKIPYYGELERDKNNVYVCPHCYANDEYTDAFPYEKIFSPQASAIFLASQVGRELLSPDEREKLFKLAFSEREKNTLLRTVSSDADFIEAAEALGFIKEKERLEKDLIGECMRYSCPSIFNGRIYEGIFDSETAARIVNVLIK